MKLLPAFGFLVVPLLILSLSSADTVGQFGEVVYPLLGNVLTEEGTFLYRIRIEEDLQAQTNAWFQPVRKWEEWNRFIVANVKLNENHGVLIFWKFNSKRPGLIYTSVRIPGLFQTPPYDLFGKHSAQWKEGETHVVGYTWNREGKHTLWLDGEAVGSSTSLAPAMGLGEVDGEKARLILGGHDYSSALTFFGVHILDRALSGEEMKKSPAELFKAQKGSLLLDCFEKQKFQPDGKIQTKALVISGFSGESGGTPSRECSFVETPQGQGLCLYTPPPGVSIK